MCAVGICVIQVFNVLRAKLISLFLRAEKVNNEPARFDRKNSYKL